MNILLLSGGNDSMYILNKYNEDFEKIYFDYGQPYKDDELENIPEVDDIIEMELMDILPNGYVKGRNLLFLIEIARRYSDGTIWMGTNKDDIFPDNNERYLKSAMDIINVSFGTNLTIKLPLKDITKKQIMKYINLNKINTYSCYKGGITCGKCKACISSNA